jgi:glycosyltransferase involved in cell wall biosynthesis
MMLAQPLATRPTVSVVIPCYNYGRYLPGALRSVLDQDDVDLEITIVDDASTDGSTALAQSLADADPRITLVQHQRNLGHIATYNDGLRRAAGDYVVLLSADDLLAPGSLGRACALMERRSDVGLVYGFAPDFTDEPPPAHNNFSYWSAWDGETWIAQMCRRGANIIVNPEAVLRRSVMDILVGYRADLPQSADMELWMRAATLANVGRVNGPPQGFYRVHDANMHLNDFQGLLTEMRARRDTFREFFAREGAELSAPEKLRERALRTIAFEAMREARAVLTQPGRASIEHAAGFAELAVETWPRILKTSLYRQYQRRQNRPVGRARRYLEGELTYVRGALRWRRWRRFGT